MADLKRINVGTRFQAALSAKDWNSAYGLLADNASWAFHGDDLIFNGIKSADAVAAIARTLTGSGANVALVCRLRHRKIAAIEAYFSDAGGIDVLCA